MTKIVYVKGESKYVRDLRYRQTAERARKAGEPFPLPVRSGASVLDGGPIPGYEKYACGGRHSTMRWSQATMTGGKPHCPYCGERVMGLLPAAELDESDAQIRRLAAATQASNAAIRAKRRPGVSRIWFGKRAEQED